MRMLVGALLAAAAVCVPGSAMMAQPAWAAVQNSPDAAFDQIAARAVAAVAQFQPEYGTTLGDHRFDDRLSDPSAAGRARTAAIENGLLAELGRIDRSKLTRDNQVDALLLDNQLRYSRWARHVLQSWAWNAQVYNDAAAGALYGLAARDFAPWPQRLKAATARMEAMPAFLPRARRQLVPAKVPGDLRDHASPSRTAGMVEIAEGMLAPHAGELDAADRARFDAALAGLKAAVAEQQKWLDTVLVPAGEGRFPARRQALRPEDELRAGVDRRRAPN